MAIQCWECGDQGHIASACPNILAASGPDDARKTHFDRIGELVRLWQDGMLTVDEKRRGISAENQSFYGPDCPRHLIWHGEQSTRG